ncbi:MAG: hypothetical protein ACOYOL_13150, partial [Chthoniobacterales bacterium]
NRTPCGSPLRCAAAPRASRSVSVGSTGKRGGVPHDTAEQGLGAARQLGFVLAAHELAPQVHVRVLNDVVAWGPSDHCRVKIVVG